MVYGLYFVKLNASSRGSTVPFVVSATVEMPFVDVYASTALTALTAGIIGGSGGVSTSYIKNYGFRKPDGTLDGVTVPTDAPENALYIPQCFYVEFRLAVVQAEASMHGTVLVFSLARDSENQMQKMDSVDFVDEKNNLIASHHFSLLQKGSQIKLNDHVDQTRQELAKLRASSESKISVVKKQYNLDLINFIPLPGRIGG